MGALGVANRGVISEIVPNRHDYLECDECGACIDICPVGALTSGSYRYQTRPWEMDARRDDLHALRRRLPDHAGRARRQDHAREQSRFAAASTASSCASRAATRSISWSIPSGCNRRCCETRRASSSRFPGPRRSRRSRKRSRRSKARGGKFGVIGSNHTTNEENYFLQKFARQGLGTKNIDHHRTGDLGTFFDALSGKNDALATAGDLYTAKAVLVVGADLAQQHPFLSYQARANFRHHSAHIYAVTTGSGSRRQSGGRQRSRRGGRGTGRRRIPARQAEGGRRSGHRLRRFHPGRRRTQAGRVRRFAGHPGEIRLPGGLFEFARRVRHGPDSAGRRHERRSRCWPRRIWTFCGWSARIR